MGTPEYMAPETIRGEEPDRRVDVYAIGCLLRFALTGEPLFRSQNHVQLLLTAFAGGSNASLAQR